MVWMMKGKGEDGWEVEIDGDVLKDYVGILY